MSTATTTNTTNTAALRVLVVDDDTNVRNDFRRLLELESDLNVVGVAHDGSDAIDQCANLSPDVVVMDIRMPVMDGITATQRIRDADNAPAVLIMTTFDLDEYVLGAIRAGAAGFLLKDQAPEKLADAVRTVANGDAILGPRATARLLAEFVHPSTEKSNLPALLDTLTKREHDVLLHVAQGRSNEEIAEALFVSVPTVKTHMSNLLMKLGIENRVQVVVWAYENGVVSARR
jgi:DNA-binding NarL/FixJ family response regulator